MKTWRPFERYCPQLSACFPHTTMLCHSVRSCRCPFVSVHCSEVATGKRATARPLGVNRSSGSLPRLPISMALLSDITAPPCVRGTIVARRRGVNGFALHWRGMFFTLTHAGRAVISCKPRRVGIVFALKLLGIAVNTALMAPAVVLAAAADARHGYTLSQMWATVNLWLTGV